MDSPVCAACGQPVVEASGSPGQSPALFLFFRGKRWVFCAPACRLVFKRDAARLSEEHSQRGLAPYPDKAPVPPRADRRSPFAKLLTVAALKERPGARDQTGPTGLTGPAERDAPSEGPGPAERGET